MIIKKFIFLVISIIVIFCMGMSSCTNGRTNSNIDNSNNSQQITLADDVQNDLLRKMQESASSNDLDAAKNYYDKVIGIFYEKDDYDGLISSSRLMASLDTTYVKAYETMQYAYHHKGMYEEALDLGAIIDNLTEETGDWQKKHVNYVFTGLVAYDAKDYDTALNLLGAAIKDDYVVKEYGYMAYCYLSAIYTKLNNESMASELKAVAMKIKEEGTEEYIKQLVER